MANFDKSLTYNAETQTLVGTQYRELVDTQTGEIINVQQVTKRVYGTKNFWKIYLMDFMTVLGILDSKQVDILVYIMEHISAGTNTFIGTYKKISSDVGVSEPTIATVMKKLQKANFIRKVQNGVWAINPDMLMKGNDNKRQMLLSYYNEQAQYHDSTEPDSGESEHEQDQETKVMEG
ncbi:MAG: replication/maintenance protein RepL [Ruminococcus flavefaciens]|nr:replication/maintenance protein RepL [Ruminococcus flavefaciens]